jgi:1-acyl-sn-glycerol-3-phosphate acyltransferase
MSQGMVPKQDPSQEIASDAPSPLEASEGNRVSMPRLTAGQVWAAPMPLNRQAPTKWLSKAALSLVARKVVSVSGMENIAPSMDPFIIALNHSQKLEAIYIPALLHFIRKGKLIHFLADWNFCLVPGIWLFYHFGEVITVARKPARPRFLNVFKPLFIKGQGPFDQAIEALQSGRSIGIFPEGTTNRRPDVLLKGYSGAAQLSLQLGIPVVPAGISFPQHNSQDPIPEGIPFSVEFGKPLVPTPEGGKPSLKKVRDWHVEIMSSISRLSGKTWNRHQRKK